MKKSLIASLIFVLIFSIFMTGCENPQPKELKIGDYVQFGKYNDALILWRVIHIDQDGNPLLFSDRILSLKAFDAGGDYHNDDYRIDDGSNYWKDSNIRQWLNTDKKSGTIKWIQNPPSKENMCLGYNPYEDEEGFLADKNFTESEKNIIKPVNHKVLLSNIDKDKKTGGEELHTLSSDIYDIVQNYDNAYYENIEDKVFFLSVKELHNYIWENQKILGKEYYIGKPTKQAVAGSSEKNVKLNYNNNWHTWSRTPFPDSPDCIRVIDNNGSIFHRFAYFGGYGGVRPALYINLSSTIFKSGSGIKSDPYIIKGSDSE